MIIKDVKVCEYNVPNKNGRIYTAECFDLDNNFVLKERLDNNCLFGEIDFPQDGRTEIDLTKVSHRIINLTSKEDGLYADIEILDTPNGRILQKILDSNNFRTRGTGDLSAIDNNGNCTVENYFLLTIDYTKNPA